MVDTGNILHLLEQAVRQLAVGEQDVKSRVRSAYIYLAGGIASVEESNALGPNLTAGFLKHQHLAMLRQNLPLGVGKRRTKRIN
jgi:hypothetical protein